MGGGRRTNWEEERRRVREDQWKDAELEDEKNNDTWEEEEQSQKGREKTGRTDAIQVKDTASQLCLLHQAQQEAVST